MESTSCHIDLLQDQINYWTASSFGAVRLLIRDLWLARAGRGGGKMLSRGISSADGFADLAVSGVYFFLHLLPVS
jgi:hypothetical protein